MLLVKTTTQLFALPTLSFSYRRSQKCFSDRWHRLHRNLNTANFNGQ